MPTPELPPFPFDPSALSEWIERLVDAKVAAALASVQATQTKSKYLTVNEAAELMRAPRQRVYDLLWIVGVREISTDAADSSRDG